MKVAKNMDSVFANCTQDELDYDLIFDNDDTIIDFIAGVDESGELVTGPNFDYSKILEEADMLEDQDDTEARDGKVDHKPAPAEGSKDTDLEVGGEVGDGKEVSGEEKSKESEAHDMTKLGSETAQQTAIQKAMEISAKKFADQSNNCCKENAEYEGYEELIEAVVNGFMSEEEIMSEDASQIAINTADYLISECADAEARDGKVDPDNKGNVEGVKSEVIDNQTKGSANGDPIADDCDQAARDGKVAPDKNVEGVANRIMGAALEGTEAVNEIQKINAGTAAKKAQHLLNRTINANSEKSEKTKQLATKILNRAIAKGDGITESASGDIHKDIEDQTLDSGVESMNKDIVPDSVRMNGDSNNIDIKQEASKFVEDSYKDLIGGMKTGLQKLALADALSESVIETVDMVVEAAETNNIPYAECAGYDTLVEAVIAGMSEDQINMENAVQFAMETVDYILNEFKKVPEKKAADRALKHGKRALQSAEAGGANAPNMIEFAGELTKKAVKANEKKGNTEVVEKLKDMQQKLDDAKKPEEKEKLAKRIINWVKNNPVAAGVAIVGTTIVAVGGAIAAKKIADKKKKQKEENEEKVEENVSFSEYNDIVEAVVSVCSEEEIMAENASEFVCETADALVEYYMNSDEADVITEATVSELETLNAIAKEYGLPKIRGVEADEFKKVANVLSKKGFEDADILVGYSEKLKSADGAEKLGILKKIIAFFKKNKKAIIGITGGAALVGGAVGIAKSIAAKKKKDKENDEVQKENSEYPEYMDLIEAVISEFTEEEIMAENASEMACAVADILIEKSDVEDYITNDDDDEDIETIASNNDPKVDLTYDYDDDELIDMVVNDTQL